MIIAIDFDGTIAHGSFPTIDGLMPDAKKYIERLKADGHYIIINTCRSGDQLTSAVNYLLEQGVPFDRINDNEPRNCALYGNNSRKIYAHKYIDDRQVGGLPPWSEIYRDITDAERMFKG